MKLDASVAIESAGDAAGTKLADPAVADVSAWVLELVDRAQAAPRR